MKDSFSPPKTELWEQQPVITAAMLGALRENPLTQTLSEAQLLMLVERALQDKCRGDNEWLAQMLPRIHAGEDLLAINVDSTTQKLSANDTVTSKVHPHITITSPIVIHTQEDLDLALKEHLRWIKNVLEPGQDLGPGRANFKGCDLRAFNFDGVDLRAAILEDCNFSGVSFIQANLAGAKLARSNFEGACLETCRLRRADLTAANLNEAKLRNADFRHAITKGILLHGADLSDVIGLADSLQIPKEKLLDSK